MSIKRVGGLVFWRIGRISGTACIRNQVSDAPRYGRRFVATVIASRIAAFVAGAAFSGFAL